MGEYLEIEISPEDEGKPVLFLLRNRLSLSAARIRSVKFAEGGILLNGERVTVRKTVHAGDKLKARISDSEKRRQRLILNPLPLDVLYEDAYYIAVNKPAGMVCHPSRGHSADSLANALAAHFVEEGGEPFVHLIGRLDKETSGVVLAAKNAAAAAALQQRRSGQITGSGQGNAEMPANAGRDSLVKKQYLAAAEGTFAEPAGSITIPMKAIREPDSGLLRMEADTAGQPAVTHYEVVESYGDWSLLRVEPETGRMHQIRFHMAAIGHPLLGDRFYGRRTVHSGEELTMHSGEELTEHGDDRIAQREALSISEHLDDALSVMHRTALHAYKLSFTHPFTEEDISLTAPLPEDLRQLMSRADS